jgi:hypothetical protein
MFAVAATASLSQPAAAANKLESARLVPQGSLDDTLDAADIAY